MALSSTNLPPSFRPNTGAAVPQVPAHANNANTKREFSDFTTINERPAETGSGGSQYYLGPELLELDILGISRRHVAESFGSITDDVVIGIRNDDAVANLAEIRKRRRM
ncbi:hypothetical protein SEUCBS139899_007622 [Sporothrix eucalyptigena]